MVYKFKPYLVAQQFESIHCCLPHKNDQVNWMILMLWIEEKHAHTAHVS